jgi:hypothetical protein
MKRVPNLLLLALLIICGLSLWLGRGEKRQPAARAPTPAVTTDSLPPLDWGQKPEDSPVHLVVLNGTPRASLAREVSLALTRAGCIAERTDNAPHDHFAESLLINRRLPAGRARELALRLGGLPVLLEKDPRSTEDALLVLGADYARVCRALELEVP